MISEFEISRVDCIYILYLHSSISAQSSFAIGAILNATFGSFVELFLYVISMVKGRKEKTLCYVELVRSALTGRFLYVIFMKNP